MGVRVLKKNAPRTDRSRPRPDESPGPGPRGKCPACPAATGESVESTAASRHRAKAGSPPGPVLLDLGFMSLFPKLPSLSLPVSRTPCPHCGSFRSINIFLHLPAAHLPHYRCGSGSLGRTPPGCAYSSSAERQPSGPAPLILAPAPRSCFSFLHRRTCVVCALVSNKIQFIQ